MFNDNFFNRSVHRSKRLRREEHNNSESLPSGKRSKKGEFPFGGCIRWASIHKTQTMVNVDLAS